MMQEKRWISWARKQITARVAANSEVARCMYTQEASGEVTLHNGGEVQESWILRYKR